MALARICGFKVALALSRSPVAPFVGCGARPQLATAWSCRLTPWRGAPESAFGLVKWMARSVGSGAPTWRRRSGASLRRRGVAFECGCAARALARLAIDFKSRVGRTGCGRRPRARRCEARTEIGAVWRALSLTDRARAIQKKGWRHPLL